MCADSFVDFAIMNGEDFGAGARPYAAIGSTYYQFFDFWKLFMVDTVDDCDLIVRVNGRRKLGSR